MKYPFFLIAIMAFLIASCEKEKTVNNPVGLWKITKFTDDGKDETTKFSNYSFDFQANGKLVVTIGSNSYTGVWNDNLSDEKIDLKISGTQNLDTINDDWLIIEMTTTTLKLKDDDSEDEEIIFTKM